MKRSIRRAAAAFLAAALCLGGAMPVRALEYQGSESYMQGKYYEALQQVKLTGDPRTDIVNVALSQVGYQESTYMKALSGEIVGNVNFTEYGQWYDMQDQWCAIFVSWCAALAGISKDVVPKHSYTPNGLYWLKDKWGRAYSRAKVEAGAYTPQPGDLIYFKSASTKNTTNHVGIVTGYRDGIVYTVEGNTTSPAIFSSGGTVARKSYAITNQYIVYICSPDYELSGLRLTEDTTGRTTEEKLQAIADAVCVLESGAADGYDVVGRNAQGELTLGCAQWSGRKAQELLERIRQADPALPAGEQIEDVRTALCGEAGIAAQKAMLAEALQAGQTEAASKGVTDADALLAWGVLGYFGGEALLRQTVEQRPLATAQQLCDVMEAQGCPGVGLIREALR